MAKSGQVHWHEGLFLQPHHLQWMQRSLFDRFSVERRLAWPAFPYGVIEERLSDDALENGLIEYDRLEVIMPSGLYVCFPDNADLDRLNINEALKATSEPLTVCLGVPLWNAHGANAIEPGPDADYRVKRLFRVHDDVEAPDENTGRNEKHISVRRINARLMLDSEDPTDMEVLPLVRITHAAGQAEGAARRDRAFVPACLLLKGSPFLLEKVRDLAHQVEASRKDQVRQIQRSGFSVDTIRGQQFAQLLRLRTLNRFSGRLLHLVQAPGVTPLEMYLELRELMGELAALYPDRDHQFEVANYDHDRPAISFNELMSHIRELLRGEEAVTCLEVPFTMDEEIGALVATLDDEHFTRPNEYYLSIKTQTDRKPLTELVEDDNEFKLMPRSLASSRVRGVKLAEDPNPPPGLRSQAGLYYFRLLPTENERRWDDVKKEKAMAIRWPGMGSSDFVITLCMTVSEMGDAK